MERGVSYSAVLSAWWHGLPAIRRQAEASSLSLFSWTLCLSMNWSIMVTAKYLVPGQSIIWSPTTNMKSTMCWLGDIRVTQVIVCVRRIPCYRIVVITARVQVILIKCIKITGS